MTSRNRTYLLNSGKTSPGRFRHWGGSVSAGLLTILTLLFFLFPSVIQAKEERERSPWSVSLSYYGEWISQPGFTLGAEYLICENEKESVKLFTALSGGGYFHDQNHNAFFADSYIGSRFTTPVGYFGDILLGAGYLHTWPDGVVYTGVDSEGNLIEKDHPGDPHLKLNVSFGFLGWDFSKRTDLPVTAVARMALFGEYPYNDFVLPHVALQIEFTYRFPLFKGVSHV